MQPRVDAVLTGWFPAKSGVEAEDLTAADLDSGLFSDARLQFFWRGQDSGRAGPLPARLFFFLEHVLSVYFLR